MLFQLAVKYSFRQPQPLHSGGAAAAALQQSLAIAFSL